MRLPHTATWIRPGTRTDGNGDPVPDWDDPTTSTLRAFLQPQSAAELLDGRDAQIGTWVMFATEPAVEGAHRITWAGRTFDVIGPPALFTGRTGRFHHIEAQLRVVEG